MNEKDEVFTCEDCASDFPVEEANNCPQCGIPVCHDCYAEHHQHENEETE